MGRENFGDGQDGLAGARGLAMSALLPRMEKASTSVPVALARTMVRALWQAGVREAVVCAGARNAVLVAVLAAARGWKLWSFPEERSAAFFALGRAAATARPVAVVTTSGTAAAELLPAMIEAHYQGVPLVAVTADRPRTYRGTGAPQAIEQVGLFGPYVSHLWDIESVEEAELAMTEVRHLPPCCSWHLNICLEEPSPADLVAAEEPLEMGEARGPISAEAPDSERREASRHLGAFLAKPGPMLAMVSSLPVREVEPAATFLQRLGCPVWAEATSGLREHVGLMHQQVRGGETSVAAASFTRLLRLGGVPSSRWWRDVEQRRDIDVCSLTSTGFSGLARPSLVLPFPQWDEVPVPPQPSMAPWQEDAERAAHIETSLAFFPHSEPALVRSLSEVIPPRSLVFLGNSLPIREWNAFANWEARELRCRANRGANGIDGLVSTFLGWGGEEEESWAVMGDLSALYDLAGLWVTPALPPRRRRLTVINNGGGRIFGRAVSLRGASASTRGLMENPHSLNFRAWADLWGWEYRHASNALELREAARSAAPHILIEVMPDAAQTEAFWAALR